MYCWSWGHQRNLSNLQEQISLKLQTTSSFYSTLGANGSRSFYLTASSCARIAQPLRVCCFLFSSIGIEANSLFFSYTSKIFLIANLIKQLQDRFFDFTNSSRITILSSNTLSRIFDNSNPTQQNKNPIWPINQPLYHTNLGTQLTSFSASHISFYFGHIIIPLDRL